MNKEITLQIGQVVKILRGRDADQYAVIVSIEDSKFVNIADGNKRKFDQAKKKNLVHLEPQPFISSEVVNSLQESGRVTNGKLRFAVSQFLSDKSNADQKGE
ncbi:KOW domain-containing RNA-binding protein [Paenibacillus sp. N3/727]|uniref:KOW domain-containing RNA-binding protein n=1 Tax=Paenibacillus sp. N3/727 TaxID=2925845 RepID=UPI001F53AC13|nr:KOW domain-containing RNA-binding protein [Paenibacillus sp. N3/727]UNK17939.1 KOW domain-containing RNA-binding protein [Paenibacillus sp. N3/727]